MKITTVQAYPLSIPRPQPSWTAHEISTEATLILVEVQTDAGVIEAYLGSVDEVSSLRRAA